MATKEGQDGMVEWQNVCCPQLVILDCNDTREHRHLACVSWQTAGKTHWEDEGLSNIDNAFVKNYCLREDGDYLRCPCYPRQG